MACAPAYSTLEVNPRQRYDEAAGIQSHHDNGENPWNAEGRYLQPNTNIYHKPSGESHELSDVPHTQETPTTEPSRKTMICGFSRSVFIAGLLIALLVVIGAIAGGVAGGLSSRRNTTDSPAEPVDSILKVSRLAAANRTIGPNSQNTVFFQDGGGGLMTRYRIGPSSEWKTVNLSLNFAESTNKVELPPGAPIAAASCAGYSCGDTMAIFLGTDGILHAISDDSAAGGLEWNAMDDVSAAKLNASDGSPLAIAYTASVPDLPLDKDGNKIWWTHRLVAYEDPDGDIMVANSSSSPTRWASNKVELRNFVTNNTSLAMISQIRGSMLDQVSLVGKVTDQTGPYEKEYAMGQAIYPESETSDVGWTTGEKVLNGITQSKASGSVPTQQFAVTMRNNWRDSVYLVLSSNGTISGRIVGQHNKTMTNIRVKEDSGEPRLANFSAIATTMNGFLYGLVNDTIREYSFDTSDPSLLKFESIVYDKSVMDREKPKR